MIKPKDKSAQHPEQLPYKLGEVEKAVLRKQAQRREGAVPAPRMKVQKHAGTQLIAPDHPNTVIAYALLAEALGTADQDFLQGILRELVNADASGDGIDLDRINFLVSVVKGIAPRDQIEAMLAAQMAAVHVASMRFASRLAHVENIPQQDSAERAFNKLARTFTTQMEALKRYRTGGEQKVTVQHVSVSEGGQAIVGNVTQAAPGAPQAKTKSPPPTLTHSKEAPMPLIMQPAAVPTRDPATVRSRRGSKK